MSTVETDLTISEIEANTLTAKNNTAANKTKNENILSKISGLETKLNTIITNLTESGSSSTTDSTATDSTATDSTATDSTATDSTATGDSDTTSGSDSSTPSSSYVGFSFHPEWGGGGGCQLFTSDAILDDGTPETITAPPWETYYGDNVSEVRVNGIIKNTYPVIKLYGTTSDAASDYQYPSDVTTNEEQIQYCKDIVLGNRQLEVAGFTGDIYNTWKTTYYKMVDTVSSYTPRYSSRTLLFVLILCLIVYTFFVINKKQIKKIVKQ